MGQGGGLFSSTSKLTWLGAPDGILSVEMIKIFECGLLLDQKYAVSDLREGNPDDPAGARNAAYVKFVKYPPEESAIIQSLGQPPLSGYLFKAKTEKSRTECRGREVTGSGTLVYNCRLSGRLEFEWLSMPLIYRDSSCVLAVLVFDMLFPTRHRFATRRVAANPVKLNSITATNEPAKTELEYLTQDLQCAERYRLNGTFEVHILPQGTCC